MHKERIKTLIELLQKAQSEMDTWSHPDTSPTHEVFDLEQWFGISRATPLEQYEAITPPNPIYNECGTAIELTPTPAELRQLGHALPNCGFSACAMGVAALHQPFFEEGLHLKITYDRTPNLKTDPLFGIVLEYEGDLGFSAAARFLGISYNQAQEIFDPSCYGFELNPEEIEPHHVVARLEKLLT